MYVCAVGVRAQQQPMAGKMKLAKIEVVGLQRVKEDEIVAASGLRVGQELDVQLLDAAAEKLLASGLVKKLGYKLRERGGEATVTFEVAEAERGGNLPVVFDNFVWFTPEEIAAAVRRDVPAFDGTAADSGTVIESIRRSLAGLLAEKKIAGQVEYMASSNLNTGNDRKHVFTVTGVSVPVCTMRFPGAAAVAEKDLLATARATVLGNNYSREVVAGFADVSLRDLYQERGYLRVEFGEPSATLGGGGDAGCAAGGVTVTVPVREGVAYNWGGAQWTGNAALTPAELDAALGMKAGELANGAKIKKSLAGVERAYGHKGYLATTLKPSPDFADAARTVTFHFEVREGQQYRMGALAFVGLPVEDAERLKAKWKIQAGDVYDASYPLEFLKTALADILKPGARPHMSIDVKPDQQKLTADVKISFKFESQ
jgi:outer membrane protein assembly factor BamA